MDSHIAFSVISVLMILGICFIMYNLGRNLHVLEHGNTLDKLTILQVGVSASLYRKTFNALIKRKRLSIYFWLAVSLAFIVAIIIITVVKLLTVFTGV